jgi:phosphate transport system substrate-binding protein
VNSDPGQAILRKHGLIPYSEGRNLVTHQPERVAWIDARVFPTAVPVAAGATPTPVSAPQATADYLTRMAPAAPETQEAKERAARINAEKADKPAGQ